jgi:RNA polymerase sigma-70 factor (ECF subfamily)
MRELDACTIRKAARGDHAAFRDLYNHYAPFVWRLALRTANGDHDLARGIVQDVFIRVHGSLKKFAFASGFSTWLYRIAFNVAQTAHARRQRRRRMDAPLDEREFASQAGDESESRDAANRILRGLSPEERFLLVAREVDGKPFDELATITGVSAGALRVRLHRLREALRREFSHERT